MTNKSREQAIAWIKRELYFLRRAPEVNGCPMTPEWQEQTEVWTAALEALRAFDPSAASAAAGSAGERGRG